MSKRLKYIMMFENYEQFNQEQKNIDKLNSEWLVSHPLAGVFVFGRESNVIKVQLSNDKQNYEVFFENSGSINIDFYGGVIICKVGYKIKGLSLLLDWLRKSLLFNGFNEIEINKGVSGVEKCILNNKRSIQIAEMVAEKESTAIARNTVDASKRKIITDWLASHTLSGVHMSGSEANVTKVNYDEDYIDVIFNTLDKISIDFNNRMIYYKGGSIDKVEQLSEWIYRLLRYIQVDIHDVIDIVDQFQIMIKNNEDKISY